MISRKLPTFHLLRLLQPTAKPHLHINKVRAIHFKGLHGLELSYMIIKKITSLPQNQYVIYLSDLRERVANIMQTRK